MSHPSSGNNVRELIPSHLRNRFSSSQLTEEQIWPTFCDIHEEMQGPSLKARFKRQVRIQILPELGPGIRRMTDETVNKLIGQRILAACRVPFSRDSNMCPYMRQRIARIAVAESNHQNQNQNRNQNLHPSLPHPLQTSTTPRHQIPAAPQHLAQTSTALVQTNRQNQLLRHPPQTSELFRVPTWNAVGSNNALVPTSVGQLQRPGEGGTMLTFQGPGLQNSIEFLMNRHYTNRGVQLRPPPEPAIEVRRRYAKIIEDRKGEEPREYELSRLINEVMEEAEPSPPPSPKISSSRLDRLLRDLKKAQESISNNTSNQEDGDGEDEEEEEEIPKRPYWVKSKEAPIYRVGQTRLGSSNQNENIIVNLELPNPYHRLYDGQPTSRRLCKWIFNLYELHNDQGRFKYGDAIRIQYRMKLESWNTVESYYADGGEWKELTLGKIKWWPRGDAPWESEFIVIEDKQRIDDEHDKPSSSTYWISYFFRAGFHP